MQITQPIYSLSLIPTSFDNVRKPHSELERRLNALAKKANAGDKQAMKALQHLMYSNPEVTKVTDKLTARYAGFFIERYEGGVVIENI